MNLERLQVGMVVKNYKVLCKLLEESVLGGCSKRSQLKEWERYFKYEKRGNEFIVMEIYDEVKDKLDNRSEGNNHRKPLKNFNISSDKEDSIGIYKITLDDKIYIGSTSVGFRTRFLQHKGLYNDDMKHTYELLYKGGVFSEVLSLNGLNDITLIKIIEDMFIRSYILNDKYIVINKNLPYKDNIKNRIIKIKVDKFTEAVQLLNKHKLIDKKELDRIL